MTEDKKLQEELEAQIAEAAVQSESEAVEENTESNVESVPEEALAAAQAEVAELKDQVLRAHAEMHNIRRRADADVEKAHKLGLEKFAMEMLATVDNIERALAACTALDDATKAIHDGVEMTLRVGR